jgi:hypothetical protein
MDYGCIPITRDITARKTMMREKRKEVELENLNATKEENGRGFSYRGNRKNR